MALRQLVLANRIAAARARLDAISTEEETLRSRRAELVTREAEIEAALNEVTTETPDDERAAAEEAAEQFERDSEALTAEETETANRRASIEQQIADLQAELDEINQRAKPQPPAAHGEPEVKEREDVKIMVERRKFFGMEVRERDAIFAQDDVKLFVERLREFKSQKRAVQGSELLIPDVFLGILREQVEMRSKMLKHVSLSYVPGTSSMIIPGTIPEAVWTDMCAELNELTIGFNNLAFGGHKVGGFFAVCNAVLKDATAVNLATEFINTLAKAMAKAVDKAVIFGKGVYMPLGILTRLEQSAKPENHSPKEREWKDLRNTNIKSIPASATGKTLFQEIMKVLGNVEDGYSDGEYVWAMNRKTYLHIMIEAMNVNTNGAFVSGVANRQMPVVGGDIEIIADMPADVIIVGFGDCYKVVEREGEKYATSEHYRFVQDQTVFKGEARYDGKPSIPEAWAAIGLNGVTPSAAGVIFAGQDPVEETNEEEA